MATSYNGWPALASDSPYLHKWIVPGTDRHFICRNGSAGFLLAHFALWFHENVERLNAGQWDDWGYAYREVRGSETTLSNHASGTAIDLNAVRHPLGREGTFAYRIDGVWAYAKIRARLALYRGVLRWGGDYNSRVDEMHFELNKPLAAAEKVARALIKSPRGKRILAANPGQQRVIES